MAIERIRQKTVVAQVMEKFKELIASGQYRVHDKIPTESELAEMFGIGRSSIREAIKIFNYLGVLESQIAKGTYVCDDSKISAEALTWSILLGKRDLDELIELEGAFELWSLLSLAERYACGDDEARGVVRSLEESVRRMKVAVDAEDDPKVIEEDDQFHTIIVDSSKNSLFMSVYRTLRSFRWKEIEKAHARSPADCVQHHIEILEAVRTGEPLRVQSVYKKHLRNVKDKIHHELGGTRHR